MSVDAAISRVTYVRYLIWLFALNILVYFPSFFDVPRADHLQYFYNTAYLNDWFSLAIKSFADNRMAHPGDELLFRPVLFFLLGTERYFFGLNVWMWQVAGFVLHMTVCAVLLKFLLRIRGSIFAFFLTALFSVMYLSLEMVTWTHINAYMIAVALILGAMDQTYAYLTEDRNERRIRRAVFFLVLACFTYELAFLVSGVFFLALVCSRTAERRKMAWRYLMPAAFYAAVNLVNFIWVGSKVGANMRSPMDPLQVIFDGAAAIGVWIGFGLYPTEFYIQPEMRSILIREASSFFSMPTAGAALVAGGLVCLFGVVLLVGRSLAFLRKQSFLLSVSVLIMLVYTLMITCGRLAMNGWWSIAECLYYNYVFWAFLIIFIYSLVNFDQVSRFKFLPYLRSLVFAFLAVLIFLNGVLTFNMNMTRAKLSAPSLSLIGRVERLIRDHREEKDFSFYVHLATPGEFRLVWMLGKKQDKTFIEILYPQYFRKDNPKYIIR